MKIFLDSWPQLDILLKKIFKQKFAKRKEESETADAKVAELELEEQLRLTTIATHVDIAKKQAEPYFKLPRSLPFALSSRSETEMREHERAFKASLEIFYSRLFISVELSDSTFERVGSQRLANTKRDETGTSSLTTSVLSSPRSGR